MTTGMQGKTVLISGATNGIGQITAIELAKLGARVVIIGRSPTKTADTLKTIQTASGNPDVHSLIGDLSLMKDVRQVAASFLQQFDRLDVLVNNAGAIFNERQETAEGLETTLTT